MSLEVWADLFVEELHEPGVAGGGLASTQKVGQVARAGLVPFILARAAR